MLGTNTRGIYTCSLNTVFLIYDVHYGLTGVDCALIMYFYLTKYTQLLFRMFENSFWQVCLWYFIFLYLSSYSNDDDIDERQNYEVFGVKLACLLYV